MVTCMGGVQNVLCRVLMQSVPFERSVCIGVFHRACAMYTDVCVYRVLCTECLAQIALYRVA